MSNAATNSRNTTVDIFSGPPVKQMRIDHLPQPTGTSSSAGVTSQFTRSSIPSYHRAARRSARLAERNRVPDSHRNGITLHVSPPVTQTLQEDDVIDLITPPPFSSNPHFNPIFPHGMRTTFEHTPQRSSLGDPNLFPSMTSSQPTAVPSLVTDADSSPAFAPFMYPNLIHRPPTLSSAQETITQGSGQNSSPSDYTHNDAARPRVSSQEQQRESVIRNTHRSSRHRHHNRVHTPTRTTAEDLLGRVGVEEQSFPGVPRLLTPSEQTVPSLAGRPHWLHGTAAVPSVASSHFNVDGFMAPSHSGQTGSGQNSYLPDPTTPPMLQHDVHIPPSPAISSGPIASPFISPPPPAGHNHDPYLTALFSSNDLEPWSPSLGLPPSTNTNSGPSTPRRHMEVPPHRYSYPHPSLGDQHTHGTLSTSPQSSHVQEPRYHLPRQINLVNHTPFSRPHPSPTSAAPQVRPHPPHFPRPVMTRSRTAGPFGPPDSSGSSSQTMPSSTAGRSSQAMGRSESGRPEPELIVVDDSDSDDDVIIESWIPGPPRSSPHWRRGAHLPSTQTQVDLDEAYARQLQAHFDEEASMANRVPNWPQHQQEFEPNFGGVPVIPAGPSIPRPGTSRDDHPSGSGLIHDNFDALASRVHSWTRQDASRFLHVASNVRPRVRTGGMRSRRQLMESVRRMPPGIFIRAIIGEHAAVRLSYEDLLELADNLGPARPQGLSKATLDRLPVTHFEKSADNEDQRCVVCMSSYEEKEKVRSLPCTHEFHQECIDQWFKDHRTCPICRVEIKCE